MKTTDKMKIDLKGKRALVGGSTRGLGKAIALQLAACGAELTLMSRNKDKLESVVRELSTDHGQRHRYLQVDFQDFPSYEREVKGFFAQNEIDILVNNTNGPAVGGVLDKNIDDYQAAFDLLFKTYCITGMEAIKSMRKRGFGRVINVSSVSVKEPIANLVLSNSIRSAIVSWSKTLSREVASEGITVNNILTGSFDTERIYEVAAKMMDEKGMSVEEFRKQKSENIPAGRLGNPEEYGYLAAFLASPFSAYITGTSIPIDGGALTSAW